MSNEPIRLTPIWDFLRDQGSTQVRRTSAELLVSLLTQAAGRIAILAEETAVADDRNTIMPEDIQAGFDNWLTEVGPSLLSPEVMHDAISNIDDAGLADLIVMIEDDLEA